MNMAKQKVQHYSGIGGQAVLEGIMMKNGSMVAVGVRKPDQQIEVEIDEHHAVLENTLWTKLPFIRGFFVFLDSLILGIRSLNFSSSFYDEDDITARSRKEEEKRKNKDKAVMAVTTLISLVIAVFLFMILPYLLTSLLEGFLRNKSVLSLLEGLIRIAIFILYLLGISMMKDIRRLFQYHGAEHKCINCIERGKPLTVHYVMDSRRFHKRCGTSFLFLVMLVSVVLFFFIRVNSPFLRILFRLLLIPVIAGISYEIIRLAGRSSGPFISILSAPGLWLQRITTREPDASMCEVAIAAVEAVFDWRAYLVREFGYDARELQEMGRD